jgi:hypothetical protein
MPALGRWTVRMRGALRYAEAPPFAPARGWYAIGTCSGMRRLIRVKWPQWATATRDYGIEIAGSEATGGASAK